MRPVPCGWASFWIYWWIRVIHLDIRTYCFNELIFCRWIAEKLTTDGDCEMMVTYKRELRMTKERFHLCFPIQRTASALSASNEVVFSCCRINGTDGDNCFGFHAVQISVSFEIHTSHHAILSMNAQCVPFFVPFARAKGTKKCRSAAHIRALVCTHPFNGFPFSPFFSHFLSCRHRTDPLLCAKSNKNKMRKRTLNGV